MNQSIDDQQDTTPSSAEPATQRSEEREQLGAGIDRQHQHIQKIADHLQQDQHQVQEIQEEVGKMSDEARHIRETLKPGTQQENGQ